MSLHRLNELVAEAIRIGSASRVRAAFARNGWRAWFSEESLLQAAIQKHNIDLVLDVGANAGQFVRKLRSVYRGDVHSFEPVRSTFESLQRATCSDARWHCHRIACGDVSESRDIRIHVLSELNSFYAGQGNLELLDGHGVVHSTPLEPVSSETVRVERLDMYLPSVVEDLAQRRLFLKTDTQGHDLSVFAGAEGILPQVFGLIAEVSLIPLYEGMPHWLEQIAVYESAGFRINGMLPVNHSRGGHVIEFDCLMTR